MSKILLRMLPLLSIMPNIFLFSQLWMAIGSLLQEEVHNMQYLQS